MVLGFMILDLKFNSVSSVTFSRLEPEGKLVMGFRKATSAPPSDQVCPSAIAEHFFSRLSIHTCWSSNNRLCGNL
jgi:hypothetical protein